MHQMSEMREWICDDQWEDEWVLCVWVSMNSERDEKRKRAWGILEHSSNWGG